jgi:predicted TIM-barrel fold metal-dependent hydrolase
VNSLKMKIDIFTHILPEKYLAMLLKKAKIPADSKAIRNVPASNLGMRLRLMDRFPDVLQVLTVSPLPLDEFTTSEVAIELCKMANDELAELVVKYPDKFLAGVACLPLDNTEAALEETDRAITKLGLKGIQLFARISGEQLDAPKFRPLYKKMAQYDLPIWIHPVSDPTMDESVFGWPFATSNSMRRLVIAGIFDEFPNIKFITHHCGAMAPYFEGRIKWLFPLGLTPPARHWAEHFRKFYADTATYGTTSALECGSEYFGIDHILFGTDAPYGPQFGMTLETIESIERMNISETDKVKIFERNAVNLLKIAI